MLVCVREQTQTQVLERRCLTSEKPSNRTIRCNMDLCPSVGFRPSSYGNTQTGSKPYWGGTWSACSATCGPGEQTRVPVCMKDNIPTYRSACSDPPITTRKCEIASCDSSDNELEPTAAQWHTGGWSQVSLYFLF